MKVLTTDWQSSKAQLTFVRHQVFVLEQGVPEKIEQDGEDEQAVHFVAFGTTAVPTGVCRLQESGKIGRLAVLPAYRHQGYASLLMKKVIQVAREMGLTRVYLHSQADSQVFYEKHGFKVEGDTFMEADIPHVLMTREI
ncbi:GNAT family N-acetyltransferase [Marinomonas agarivorans]|nr:GNAT family N-acetyltransferase [Marinomonas agarivorans]